MECAFLTFIKSFFFFLRLRLKSFSKFRKYLCKLMPEKWIPGHWGSVRAIYRGKSPDLTEGVHLTDVHLASSKTRKERKRVRCHKGQMQGQFESQRNQWVKMLNGRAWSKPEKWKGESRGLQQILLLFPQFTAAFCVKIILLCLIDIKLGLVTYFDQRKVSRTVVCPFQSFKSHCRVSMFVLSLPDDLPVPDGSCQQCTHNVS